MSTKIIIAAVAGVAVVGLAGYGLYRKFRKNDEVKPSCDDAKTTYNQKYEAKLKEFYCSLSDEALQATRDEMLCQDELSDSTKLCLAIIDSIIAERKLSNHGDTKSAE